MNNNSFILRKFKESDINDLYQALHDKRVIRHMATEKMTIEDCKTIVLEAIKHWNNYKIGSYAVIDSISEKLIGWAGFQPLNDDFELLIVLSPKYWGLGKDIYSYLIEKAKDEFLLKKVYVLLPITRKSFKFIETLGFLPCGEELYKGILFKRFVKEL